MPAYCVFICKRVHDRSKLETYWANARKALAGHQAKMLAAYTNFEVIEGDDAMKAVAMAEFPSMEGAQSWYKSPAYADFRKLRLEGADFFSFIVDGGIVPVDQRLLPDEH